MKADTSRFTFDPRKHYRGVLTQQGRVQLDADWNEQQSIVAYRAEATARDIIGDCGGPLDSAGFAVVTDFSKLGPEDQGLLTKLGLKTLQPGDFFISAGHYYVDGVLCENEHAWPFSKQPDAPGLAPISDKGTYLLYLHVWERLLTALDDPSMRETALGGPDTATRSKIVWQAQLLKVSNDPSASLDCESQFADYDDLTKPSDGTLAAQTTQSGPPVDPCDVSPAAGYRGLENQLYRVEIHKGSKSGGPTFKWSRDNGSVVTSVTKIDDANKQITVQSVGPDKVLDFEAEQWVELTDDRNDLGGAPGELLQIKQVTPATGVITLKTAPTKLANNSDGLDPSLRPKLRRWDQTGTGATSNGVKATGNWTNLESSIQVKFTAGGTYRTGDYWLIPARTVNLDPQSGGGVIEWPSDANGPLALTPQGVTHRYCRLALVRWDGASIKASDCRCLFPRVTEMTDLFYVSGDGQEAMPDLLNPSNLVKLPQPLVVGVSNAHCRDRAAKVRFSVLAGDGQVSEHGKAPVGSGKVADVLTDGAGLASCDWQIDPKTRSQQVEARLLGSNDQPLFLPVVFNANLSIAELVAYDPKQCGGLKDQVTVQSAIDRLAAQVSLYAVDGGGQELMPGESAKHLKVVAANRCGPVAGVKVRFAVVSGAGKVNNASPSATVTTDSQGVAECTWALDDTSDFQQVVATFDNSETRPKAAPDTAVFTANLSRAQHVAYKPAAECTALAGVANVQEALDKLCALERGGGCSVTVGEGGQYRLLDEAFQDLDVKQTRDICICLLPGDHHLGSGLRIAALPTGLERHVKIEGCGRGSRVVIHGKPLTVEGLASFTMKGVSVESGEVVKPVSIRGCREVNVYDSYLRQVNFAFTELLTIDRAEQATRVRLHNNYLESWFSWEGPGLGVRTITSLTFQTVPSYPAPQQLFAQVRALARQLGDKSAQASKARAAFAERIDGYIKANSEMPGWLRQRYETAAKALKPSQAGGRAASTPAPDVQTITAALIAAFLPATALVIMKGVSDVELLNNQIVGGARLYESGEPDGAGPLPPDKLDPLFKGIEQNSFLIQESAGLLLFGGNHFTSLEIGNGVDPRAAGTEKLTGLYRRCSLTDNTFMLAPNSLLADQMTLTGNGFNENYDTPEVACVLAGRGIIIADNSAPNAGSSIKYAISPSSGLMRQSANLLNVVPY